MRTLYYVPIIHSVPDMGSLARALEEGANAALGQEAWQRHRETVSAFWESVDRFFDRIDVSGFRVYQDGLVAGGAAGRDIVSAGAGGGSRNFGIIEKLLARGAELVRTEDASLVKQEHGYISRIAGAKTPREREVAAFRYRLAQDRLLRERDSFIAMRIADALGDGETGVLFIGADHDVLSRLPSDVRVVHVKDVRRVREYHQALAVGRSGGRLPELARYLTAPVASGV